MQVRGPIAPRRLSVDAIAALNSGNVDELLRINRAEFGGWRMMAEPDDDDDDDKKGNDSDKDDDDKSKGTGSDDADKDDDADADAEKLRKRMKAADKRADEAERKLREREDAEKDEVTKAKEKVLETEKEIEGLRSTINDLRLQNAFLTANTHPWHDPDDALDVAQRKGYLEDVTDDDGVVSKKDLAKALDRLAKEKPYLVKSKDKDKDDEPGGPSGEPAGGRSDNTKDDKAKEEARRRRFPILNR